MNQNIYGVDISNLSENEKELVLEILKEIKNQGASSTYEDIVYADYKEKPVDIITFIKDDTYLGKAWHMSDGTFKLFPFWEKKLKELFPDNLTTAFNTFIESGARGLGKSEIAITCILYLMYRLMCLKDPHLYLNLKPTEKVAFAFMNITEDLSYDIGVTKFQNTVQASPWFMSRGIVTGRKELIWNPPEWIDIIVGSQPRHVIGKPVYAAFFDEISFIAHQDIEKQKAKAIDMIDTALGGMKTRFTNKGKNPTLLILASSKRSEKSFLEVHTKKKMETEGENLLVVDEPVWNVRPSSEYSGKKFNVAQGNRYLASEVIPDDADLKTYINKGYKILSVPIEYRAQFLEEIDRALCDYAGVSSSDLTKYISGVRLQAVKRDTLHNGFTKDVIEVGNSPEDKIQYNEYFNIENIDKEMLSKPLYIHLDMSLSGDRTGIAGVWIKGKKPTPEGQVQSKDLFYQIAFSVGIQAPRGYQVSMEKNRQFIRWLRQQGFRIKGLSCDSFQSADLIQQLKAEKFNCSVISVDRINSDKICEPYQYLKSTIYEERIIMYDSQLLTTELLGLEKDSNGRINHPDEGRSGSKDISDSVCGAVWNASQHAEEFAFEYGEDIENITTVSMTKDQTMKNQIVVDFESELKSAFSGLRDNSEKDTSKIAKQVDFGLGPATPALDSYIHEGIMIW